MMVLLLYKYIIILFYYFSLSVPFLIFSQKRIYESAPWSVEAWGRPLESFALATTRLAGAGNNSSLNVSKRKMKRAYFRLFFGMKKSLLFSSALILFRRDNNRLCSALDVALRGVSLSIGCARKPIVIWPPGLEHWFKVPIMRSTISGSSRFVACIRAGSVNWLCI